MTLSPNPYVGPRTFTEKEAGFFFGREREARDLTARIVSERLQLFYAQSGAGKSSLLNARIIPNLRDEEGFQVLPVGRVSGELPAGLDRVGNIFVFNLIAGLDHSGAHPDHLAQVSLSDFLARLVREAGVDAEGRPTPRWVYRPEIEIAPPLAEGARPSSGPRFVLIIDQFEEIITSHPGRWKEREAFFDQLNQALLDDPNLWVVLTLREDYVAALDPYAERCFNRLRARFYMERMKVEAALEAIQRPAEKAGRTFGPGVAQQLADNLRQVRVPGQQETVAGQYVEPVQLQVVCFQMWESLAEDGGQRAEVRGRRAGGGGRGAEGGGRRAEGRGRRAEGRGRRAGGGGRRAEGRGRRAEGRGRRAEGRGRRAEGRGRRAEGGGRRAEGRGRRAGGGGGRDDHVRGFGAGGGCESGVDAVL